MTTHSEPVYSIAEVGGWCRSALAKTPEDDLDDVLDRAIDNFPEVAADPLKEHLRAVWRKATRPKRRRKESVERPPIPEKLIQGWVQELWKRPARVQWLREWRGLAEDTLRKYCIGWVEERGRYTIPVYDIWGETIVNVRLYNRARKAKLIHYTDENHGYGSPPQLYGADEIFRFTGKQAILCEGEWDRLLLQQAGFMAVSGTHGASVFPPGWALYFRRKEAIVLYDCDEPGRKAAQDVAIPALATNRFWWGEGPASIKNVRLPLSGADDDKDVTDYFLKGHTAAELQGLIDSAPSVSPAGVRARG